MDISLHGRQDNHSLLLPCVFRKHWLQILYRNLHRIRRRNQLREKILLLVEQLTDFPDRGNQFPVDDFIRPAPVCEKLLHLI